MAHMDNLKTQEYSLCFIFNQELDLVLLIEKNRPEWQKGFFNGIGGKFEKNETIKECTLREINEECGIRGIDDEKLKYVGNYCFDDNYIVYITTIKLSNHMFSNFKQKTDEKLVVCRVEDVLTNTKILTSAKTAIAASIQKLHDNTMGEMVVKYYN